MGRHCLFTIGRTKSWSLYRMLLGRFRACSIRASYRRMEFNAGFRTLEMDLWNFNASFLILKNKGLIFRFLWMTSFRAKQKALTCLRNSRFLKSILMVLLFKVLFNLTWKCQFVVLYCHMYLNIFYQRNLQK